MMDGQTDGRRGVAISPVLGLRRYINEFLSYSAKTKRDRQTDGWGHCFVSRASGATGDKKHGCVINGQITI